MLFLELRIQVIKEGQVPSLDHGWYTGGAQQIFEHRNFRLFCRSQVIDRDADDPATLGRLIGRDPVAQAQTQYFFDLPHGPHLRHRNTSPIWPRLYHGSE